MEEKNDDKDLLLLIGGGALLYLLSGANNNSGGSGANNNSGGSGANNNSGGSGANNNSGGSGSYTDAEYYALQRMLEDEQRRNREIEERYKQEYEQQKEIEDETQMVIESGIVPEEELKALDLRQQGKEKYPAEPANFYDFYNFADAETAEAIHSFTQINAINYLRFRVHKLTSLSGEDLNALLFVYSNVYDACMAQFTLSIEVANPLDVDMRLNFRVYGAKINGARFFPFMELMRLGGTWNTQKMAEDYFSDYWQEVGIAKDKDVFERFINRHFPPSFTSGFSSDSVASYFNLKNYSLDQFDQIKRDYNIKKKSIDTCSIICPMMVCEQDDFFQTFDRDTFNAVFYVYVKDAENGTERYLELTAKVGERPVLADRDKAFLNPAQIFKPIKINRPDWTRGYNYDLSFYDYI